MQNFLPLILITVLLNILTAHNNLFATVSGQANQSKNTILSQIYEMPEQKNGEVPGFFNHFLSFPNTKVWAGQAEDTTPEKYSLNTPINHYYIKSGIKSIIL